MLVAVARILRSHAMTWAITGLLPLPILMAIDPSSSVFIACIYLGLGCGWLSAEIYGGDPGMPASAGEWGGKMLAICAAVATNAGAFVLFGILAGAQTAFPFPLMATLSAIPAIGVVPWLVHRVRRPSTAVILGSMLVLCAKLAACVVARVKYGPAFVEQGYVAGDWHTAKLMISLFWVFSTLLSLSLLWAEGHRVARVGRGALAGRRDLPDA